MKGVQIKSKQTVPLVSEIEIPAGSECIVTGKCESETALVAADFEPCKVKGVNGVYISKARVQPNLDGEICVSILNVNPNKLKLFNRTRIGRVITADKILEVRPRDKISTYSINSMEIQYGPNIHSNEKRQMDGLIESYRDIFAENPKKPKLTNVLSRNIDTGNTNPVKVKSRRIPYAWEFEVRKQVNEWVSVIC